MIIPAFLLMPLFKIGATATVVVVAVGSCILRDASLRKEGAAGVVATSKIEGKKMPRMLARLMSGLALLVPLSGCAKTVVVTADELCKSWRHQSISKADKLTDATASQIEGNNNARPAWGCVPGQDKAKS